MQDRERLAAGVRIGATTAIYPDQSSRSLQIRKLRHRHKGNDWRECRYDGERYVRGARIGGGLATASPGRRPRRTVYR